MFKTALELYADARPDMWVVAAPLVWEDKEFGRLVVPKGFRTDLASIPVMLRNMPFLDPDGLSRRPAAAHDWLYAWRGWGKRNADLFLEAALKAEGASEPVARLFGFGVHWFGFHAWNKDRGALERSDFTTPEAFEAWEASAP